MSDWPVIEPGSQATPDDPVLCHLCGLDTSVAMIVSHLIEEHGFSAEEIANAPIITPDDARTQA